MKIRILSDLHRQINRNYPLELEDKDVFTLMAGDIGPNYKDNIEWIRRNIRKGALISGNHDAYGSSREFTLDDIKELYHREFPLDSDVTYFDYDVGVDQKMISDGILLVADVLYTDYRFKCSDWDNRLSEDDLVRTNIRRAAPKMSGSFMNDFFFFTKKKTNDVQSFGSLPKGVHYLSPEIYLEHFNKAFVEITRIVEENRDKEIVLMTHHCLSPRCMGKFMNKGDLSASYVSELTPWIRSHKNIRLIVSGHVHNQKKFKIGSTLYVMNPLGYCKEHHDRNWTPDFFVETDTWTVEKRPYTNKEWEETHKKEDSTTLAMASIFI
jgi:predicted phosphodiesterase